MRKRLSPGTFVLGDGQIGNQSGKEGKNMKTGITPNRTESPQVCLELVGVGKSFGGLRANHNVNLVVRQGERLAIIGPNGAGKTTLFNMISGESIPTDGKIYMYGQDVTALPPYKRLQKGMARTFQITTLFQDQSVLENVLLALWGAGKGKFTYFRSVRSYTALIQRAEAVLEQVKLSEKKDELIKNLSYGDQRMVELALALASEPKILCLDEPNAGLSVAESRVMVNAIKNLSRDITILLIEHDIDLIFEVVDRIMVLQDGCVIATDTKESIRENPKVQRIYLGESEAESDADAE